MLNKLHRFQEYRFWWNDTHLVNTYQKVLMHPKLFFSIKEFWNDELVKFHKLKDRKILRNKGGRFFCMSLSQPLACNSVGVDSCCIFFYVFIDLLIIQTISLILWFYFHFVFSCLIYLAVCVVRGLVICEDPMVTYRS